MKIIDVITEDVGDIKTIIGILSAFTSEVTADFIKDNDAYIKQLNNDTDNKNNTTQNEQSSEHDTKTKVKKQKKNKKLKKNKDNKKTNNNDNSEQDDNNSEVYTEEEKENKGLFKILTSDATQAMITHIRLNGSSFKKFDIRPDKYSVGLNIDELCKYLKTVHKESVMHIHVDSDDVQYISFNAVQENGAYECKCDLRVLNLTNKKDRKIEVDASMLIRINCNAFHSACKSLGQFAQYIEITCDPTQLVITCKGGMSNQSRTFKSNNNGIINIRTLDKDDEKDDIPNIIRLQFDVKYINTMNKCTDLCEDMEIYLNNDSVMWLKYGIDEKGVMIVGIAPSGQNNHNSDNYDEEDELYYQDDEEITLI